METSVRKFFERYAHLFNRALGGGLDMGEVAELYASEFIAASPAGVMAGKNDDRLRQVMAQGYAHYREIGTKEMRIRNIRLSRWTSNIAWPTLPGRQSIPAGIDRTRR